MSELNDTQATLWTAMFLVADPKNWLQNGARRGRKQCALMALLNAADGQNVDAEVDIFRDAVGMDIIEYNDIPGRTHEQVMEAFAESIWLAGQQ